MCLEGNRGWMGAIEGWKEHNPVQLNSTSPLLSLSLFQLKNALCKIHVFYVLTCCFCLQRDPFSSGDSVQCRRVGGGKLLRKLKKRLSVKRYTIPLMCLCIYCFKVSVLLLLASSAVEVPADSEKATWYICVCQKRERDCKILSTSYMDLSRHT